MALSLDQLNAITHKKILPKMYDNIFDSNPLLKRILASGQYQSQEGGTSIDVPLNYASTSSSGWYSGTETLATDDNESISAASFSWKNLYTGITISDEDELKNSGAAGVLKLVASKSMIAEKTIKDLLGTALYSDGTDSSSIQGLRDIVATDQTVGGIDQSSYSWWQAQVDSSTTTMTLSALNSLFEDCVIDSEKPTVAVATRANYNRYYNLLQPQQRFQDSSVAKGGFQSLMFNGLPFISDSHVPTNHVFFINEKHLHLFYHPQRNFSMEPWQKPLNQQLKLCRILWMGALASSNNRLHGKFSALAA
jgi:hypothetical protein